MPTFEFVLLVQKLERANLKEVLKRSAGYIFEYGGTLRSIENLGLRLLPYSITTNGKKHTQAHCFIMNFDSGLEEPKLMHQKFKLDVDMVRVTKFMRAATLLEFHQGAKVPECTLEQDLLPAPYRPKVIALQELAKKKVKRHTHKNYEDTDYLVY